MVPNNAELPPSPPPDNSEVMWGGNTKSKDGTFVEDVGVEETGVEEAFTDGLDGLPGGELVGSGVAMVGDAGG